MCVRINHSTPRAYFLIIIYSRGGYDYDMNGYDNFASVSLMGLWPFILIPGSNERGKKGNEIRDPSPLPISSQLNT